MKQYYFLLLLFPFFSFSQQVVDTSYVDLKYREDQFYLFATYNALSDGPSNLKQNGFSTSFQLGFIRDFPINKARNIAFGVGLGFGYNTLNQNLYVSNSDTASLSFKFLAREDGNYSKNKLKLATVDLPIEFRWRTSTAETFNFWRIYPGIKFSYLLSSQSKYEGDLGKSSVKDIDNLTKFQYGLTLSTGYSGVNLFVYYGLTPLFESGTRTVDGIMLDEIISLQFGLSFYIL